MPEDILSWAIVFAATQVDVREVGGSNKGPEVERYLASVGLGPGFAYCAAFVHWIFEQAAYHISVANPCPKTPGALTLWGLAPQHTRLSPGDKQIRPGCVFIQRHAHGKGHCGILEGVQFDANTFTTIEGNTDPSGGRDGDGVYRRTRTLADSQLVGFLDFGREPDSTTKMFTVPEAQIS